MAADIRACVDFARKKYKPTSLGLMGFCYGGGRALEEAAAGEINKCCSVAQDIPDRQIQFSHCLEYGGI